MLEHHDLPGIRYELKIVFEPTWLDEVRGWVHMHPSSFSIAYPPRWVNSVYFDTPDLDCLNDHLEGVPVRRKLRFRWYGESLRKAHGHMEVKIKSEQAGWKIHQDVDQEFDLESMDWSQIMGGLRENTHGITQELLWTARPVSMTVYSREYYLSADGQVRLTIDSELQVYEQIFSARPNLWFCQPLEPKLVLELKSDVKNSRMLADVLAHFPSRTERQSKFIDSLNYSLVK
jgi:SPX domain protein involved in polyphosphate accumulation